MTIPRATIRLQFNRDFPFDAAVETVPYLARLGLSHIYASPILAAQPGSTHGYDTIDPTAINPELGGRAGLDRLVAALRKQAMGLIIDIVPNHMAAAAENPWWWDVLRFGRASRYADHFDIDWEDADPELRGKVLLPVLGDRLEACLERGEITLERAADGAVFRYFDHRFPVDPQTATGDGALLPLLRRQHYCLAFWREAATRINWRRFFDINQLVALRMDRDAVFDDYHRLILDLRREGIIDGVRVDHVDGLAEPIAYCRKLRAALQAAAPGEASYCIVEKILHADEKLSAAWPVDGSSGYDFMDQVSAVLHDPAGEQTLTALWRKISGDERSFAALARDARREILERLFPRQRDRLVASLDAGPGAADAVRELLAAFRHYRLYGDAAGFDAQDRLELHSAVGAARRALDATGAAALRRIVAGLSKAPVRQRFEQLSATLAAKAVEDTAFYRYHRLLSRNEVGADPGIFAIPVDHFHAAAAARRSDFPAAMLATATHDTKRGEDHRARLAVLSELGTEWSTLATRWSVQFPAPEPALGLMIWQTIIGAWPPQGPDDDFARRLAAWLVKALREAKQRTAWDRPDEGFERACLDYLARLLEDDAFLEAAASFVARIAPAGIRNSLAQVLLRLTLPGVPDLYQGTEFWDFSLVDPDNRRAVDYAARARGLAADADLAALLKAWPDGRIKQALIARLLAFRHAHPALFAEGDYTPLAVSGPNAARLIAFSRRAAGETLLVVVPRLTATLGNAHGGDATGAVWQGTRIRLPAAEAQDVLRPETIQIDEEADAAALLRVFPLAVLHIRA